MGVSSLKTFLARFTRDRRGNFTLFAAITMPVCIMAAGLVIDTSNSVQLRTRMQAAADSAALATTTGLVREELTTENAKSYAKDFFRGQLTEDFPGFDAMVAHQTIDVSEVEVDGRPVWRVTLDVEAKRNVAALSLLFGGEKLSVSVRGQSEAAMESLGAISMSFVLDRSGSMDWYSGGVKKIDALKAAAGELLDQFDQADPDKKYVRTGGASYNSFMQGASPMAWGTESLRAFINALPANGGTESSVAFNWAYQAVTDPTEVTEHHAANEQVPARIMLFLTDGNNNQYWSDVATKQYCDAAKADKVEIYAVAFDAPPKGRALLQDCASSDQHYFDASNSSELVKVFKVIGLRAAKLMSRLTE